MKAPLRGQKEQARIVGTIEELLDSRMEWQAHSLDRQVSSALPWQLPCTCAKERVTRRPENATDADHVAQNTGIADNVQLAPIADLENANGTSKDK